MSGARRPVGQPDRASNTAMAGESPLYTELSKGCTTTAQPSQSKLGLDFPSSILRPTWVIQRILSS